MTRVLLRGICYPEVATDQPITCGSYRLRALLASVVAKTLPIFAQRSKGKPLCIAGPQFFGNSSFADKLIVKEILPVKSRIALTITVVLVLYIIVELVSETTVRLLIPDNYIIRVLTKFVFFSLYILFIVPYIIRKSADITSFGNYMRRIGLVIYFPFNRIIFAVLTCYFIFIISQLSGSLIYYSTRSSHYIFDFSRHSLLGSQSIIAGIFEEILFRGIILTLLLIRHAESKAVVISAAIFAGIRLLNMLNPEMNQSWVLGQAAWAFGLGIMYAYMFIRMKSLIPLILLHYFLNALVGVWFPGLDTQDVTSALYGILFFGIIPGGLSILWIRFLSRRWQLGLARNAQQ
ncbi:MAG: CPBP family intramembrane metalloprotease [Candidatus Latescibacteria bacterium]|nr:CPBP family intramembrane metalloprotease [Candidatus Latescibacterota bacterium]NIO27134.1 CPBP family intramembrane metalloprotease [Candidatus Latescibacterota bacterium]NIO54658.1 CPBP family intramembrane metalloprotease [Candidatus Latescibacterota bacterium]NIT00741.1 CPBP family intramembrane metalloprotease [Candidatus Latescibacterota bacterium]NIT37664.1 CPBP family intramembrane metalloprotease [Candidatus Latescibacterota bacterium]